MELYNQFIDFCNSLMTHITTQRLVYGALILIAFFLFWSALANHASAIRKFYKRCYKLEKYLNKHKVGYENINELDSYCVKISHGFFYGWTKFKKSRGKKPSDYLTKRDVLDAEVSDGVLNHGKTFMKTFIGVTTVLLFILNLANLGKDLTLTFDILVESMFMPFVYYVVMILIYFFSSLIKQQTYLIASSHFYTLVDSLDKCFDVEDYFQDNVEKKNNIISEETEDDFALKSLEEKTTEIKNENSEKTNEEIEETEVKNEETDEIQDEELVEEVQDEEIEQSQELENSVEDDTDETDENFKKINLEDFEINNENEVAEIQEPKAVPVARDWEAEQNLDYYDVFKKKNISVDKYINEIPDESDGTMLIDVEHGFVPSDEMEPTESEDNQDAETKTKETIVAEEETEESAENDVEVELVEVENENSEEFDDENEDEEFEDVENLIDFNEVIEETDENEESSDGDEEGMIKPENTDIEESVEELDEDETEVEQEDNELNEFDAESEENDFEEIVSQDVESEEETETVDFDFFKEEELEKAKEQEEEAHNEFKSQIEQNLNDSTQEIDTKLEDNVNANIDLSALVGEFKQNYQEDEGLSEDMQDNKAEDDLKEPDNKTTKEIFAKINDLENLISSAIGKTEAKDSKTTKKSKKGKSKMTENNQGEKKTRGRPKMQAIDENLVITSEEQFEEILSRAEKLMRKSEQGLSASQSKRIEKELKIMMDAMNKYKEG